MARELAARAAPRRTRRMAHCLVVLQLMLQATLAFSQTSQSPAPVDVPDSVHAVRPGETLFELAERYTGRSDRWQRLQQHNRIPDPRRIAPGTQVRIPAALLRAAPSFATVAYVTGDVRQFAAQDTRDAQGQPVQAGARLPEGTRIEVGIDGYLRLVLSDGSVVRVPANSRVRLADVRRQEVLQANETLIELDAGRVDVSAQPQRRESSRFEIRTPLAVASVRGTEFGVAIQPDASVTGEVTHGAVDLQGSRRDRRRREQRLRAGEGARVDNTGAVGQVRKLPAAPELTTLPATITETDFVRLPLPAAPGVAAYRVRIARDPAMEEVVRNGVSATGAMQFAGLDDGDYTVGVRAVDAQGLTGPENARALRVKARPVAPLSRRPAPDERIVGNAVEFSCTQPAGVQRFRLQVASDKAFQHLRVDDAALPECRRTAQLPAGSYFWRVASVGTTPDGKPDEGPFGASQHFALVEPPPVPPPPRFGDADDALQIYWSALPGYSYRVEVARDAGFAELVHTQTRPEASLQLQGLPSGTYHVRMQAVSAQGDAGAFSVPQTVRVGAVLRDADGAAVRDASGSPVGRQ